MSWFYLKNIAAAKIRIFDYTGRHVRALLDQEVSSGWQQLTWDGKTDAGISVASGFYICQLQVGGFKKAIIMQYVKWDIFTQRHEATKKIFLKTLCFWGSGRE